MTRKLVLKTDFYDYYDHWFDKVYYPEEKYRDFLRYSRSGMNRIEMLRYLDLKGYNTPEHGLVKDLNLNNDEKVVVYLDINSHRGMDKVLCSYKHAKDCYPMNYASKYLKVNDEDKGSSYRALRIGNKSFTLYYESNEWMSNHGPDINISILYDEIINIDNLYMDRPLLAVDFILPKTSNKLYAIDLNISPGLRHTGIEDILSSKRVFELIRDNYMKDVKV